MKITISREFAQKLLDYLSKCPYQEVSLLIQELVMVAQSRPPKKEKQNGT